MKKFLILNLALIAIFSIFSGITYAATPDEVNKFCNTIGLPVVTAVIYTKSNFNCRGDLPSNSSYLYYNSANLCNPPSTRDCKIVVDVGGGSLNGGSTYTIGALSYDSGTQKYHFSQTFSTDVASKNIAVTHPSANVSIPTRTSAAPTNNLATASNGNSGSTGSTVSNVIANPTPGINSVGDLLNKFIGLIPIVLGLLLIGYLIYGGIVILTAGAEEQKRAQGIKIIINAIIGVVVVVLSVTIVIFLQALLGQQILFSL